MLDDCCKSKAILWEAYKEEKTCFHFCNRESIWEMLSPSRHHLLSWLFLSVQLYWHLDRNCTKAPGLRQFNSPRLPSKCFLENLARKNTTELFHTGRKVRATCFCCVEQNWNGNTLTAAPFTHLCMFKMSDLVLFANTKRGNILVQRYALNTWLLSPPNLSAQTN